MGRSDKFAWLIGDDCIGKALNRWCQVIVRGFNRGNGKDMMMGIGDFQFWRSLWTADIVNGLVNWWRSRRSRRFIFFRPITEGFLIILTISIGLNKQLAGKSSIITHSSSLCFSCKVLTSGNPWSFETRSLAFVFEPTSRWACSPFNARRRCRDRLAFFDVSINRVWSRLGVGWTRVDVTRWERGV